MKILVMVDFQNDYIYGCMTIPNIRAIVPSVKARVDKARENKEMVIFTQNTHDEDNYLESLEWGLIPFSHCVYGTKGWNIIPELENEASLCVFTPTFGSFDLINRIRTIVDAFNEMPEIEICGTLLSTNVMANAVLLRAGFPNAEITVNLGLSADLDESYIQAAKVIFKRQQIEVIE